VATTIRRSVFCRRDSFCVDCEDSAKSQPKVVHIDKLKEYLGTPPRSWLTDQSRGALFLTTGSMASPTQYELPRSIGQAQSPSRAASSPMTEYSVTPDPVPNNVINESVNDEALYIGNGHVRRELDKSEKTTTPIADHVTANKKGKVVTLGVQKKSRDKDRRNLETLLTGVTASYIQQDQADYEREQVEGLTSDNVLTSTSAEQPQQGSQRSSTMGGSDTRQNLATSSFDCMDRQTQSSRLSQEGFPTDLGQRFDVCHSKTCE